MYKILSYGSLLVVTLFLLPISGVEAAGTSTATSTPVYNQVIVEQLVRDYFKDIPVMIDIAKCESKFRQFTDSGAPFRGGVGGGMIGVFQFYEQVHQAPARALGLDLATLEGNIAYARHLYTESGSTPWASCVPAPVSTLDANTQLRIELLTKLVGLLQQLLALKLAE
jgi:hypothetical protein